MRQKLWVVQVFVPWTDFDGTRKISRIQFDSASGKLDKRVMRRYIRRWLREHFEFELTKSELDSLIKSARTALI